MRGLLLASALIAVSLSACAPARPVRDLRPVANPSQVIATELAFARMAREEGTWTAFRHYATRDALMTAPGLVNAHDALRGLPDPAEPIVWGPDQVWSSCDGSYAVSTGGARFPDGRTGRFLTVWQRQRDGEYRWVLDQGIDGDEAEVAPDVIDADVATCPKGRRPSADKPRRGEAWGTNRSDDETLAWETQIAPDCSRVVTIRMATPDGLAEVFRREAPVPPARPGSDAPRCGN